MTQALRTMFFLTSLLTSLMGATVSAADLKDPTRPVNAEQQTQRQVPVLSAIMVSSNKRIAVINDHIFREGEQFEDIKVIAIHANTVDIEGSSGKETLTLVRNAFQPVK